jgi:hypothetical protein
VFGQAGARRVPASLLLLTFVLLGVAGWGVWSRAQAPTDGTTVSPASGAVSFGRIVAIDGTELAERARRLPGGPARHVGDVVGYEVRRDGVIRTVEVTLRPYPVLRGLAGWWPMVLVVVLLLATSVTVVWARPRDPAARAALLTILPKAAVGDFTVVAKVSDAPAIDAEKPLLVITPTVSPADFVVRG